MPLTNMQLTNMQLNEIDISINKIKKPKFKNIMAELLKPPPKEEKPNVHLSGGGQFSKLEKI